MGQFKIIDNELIKYDGDDTKIKIPDTVTSIADFAFYDCNQLEEITIPKTITSIGNFAFYSCENIKYIDIPKSVEIIGGGAFSYCKKLEKVSIQSKIRTIGKSTFYHCENLREIELPDSIITIDHSAFGYCKSLEAVKLPKSLKTIGDNSFEYCEKLKEVTMSDSVGTIGKKAFLHCVNLKKLKLSKNLDNVGEAAFQTYGVLSLESSENLHLKPMMFDDYWNFDVQSKNIDNYQFVNSYLPNIDLDQWKPFSRIILLTNFLETYNKYQNEFKKYYYQNCVDYKKELLDFLIKEKRYLALNQALEEKIVNSTDLDPYFDKITDREQKAKILEYKNKETDNINIFSELEEELFNMF